MSLNTLKLNPEKTEFIAFALRLSVRRFPPFFLLVFLVAATLVYKFLHSGSPSYIQPFL